MYDYKFNSESQVMKKLFFAICFNICLYSTVFAKITPISGYVNINQQVVGNKETSIKEVDRQEFSKFVAERFKNAKKAKKEEINRTTSIAESNIAIMQRKENEKNLFQKIYEKAVRRVNKPSDEVREDVADQEDLEQMLIKEVESNNIEERTKKWMDPSIPMITAYLPPYDTPVRVPAIEHIPYLMNNIEILPNGMVKFEETIVVVANAQKLKSGLTKILPAKILSKKGAFQNVDYSIIGVSINDQPINYKLSKADNKVLLVPDKDYRLPAGIYTYKFQYLADNLLLKDNDINQFYWNIGGNGWNLVIDRSFAKITTPDKNLLLQQEALIGSRLGFYKDSVFIEDSDALSHLYTAQIPLFIGTGMHILLRMDKKAFVATTFGQNFVRSFYNYGDIYISFLGLLIIVISFIVSWQYIKQGKSRVKINLNKTAVMVRYLLYDRFDKKSVCGFLLDLYKKNIIDIQQSGDTILLIKSTDNLMSLSANEKKALKVLFPSHETTFSVTKNNKLPLNRLVKILEQGLKRNTVGLNIKLNIGYIIISLFMMFIIWAGIATFKIDSVYVFMVLALTSLFCGVGTFLWFVNARKMIKIFARYLSINIFILSWVIYSAVIHPLAAILMVCIIILTGRFLKIFSGRNGLINAYIKDAVKQKKMIEENKNNISLSKGYIKYQSLILVCDLEDKIKPAVVDDTYKIPVIKNIMGRI